MKICRYNNYPNFKRKLRTSEEAEYTNVLKQAKAKASHNLTKKEGRSLLIIPVTSLPQNKIDNTGVGNLASREGQRFIDFAKKYWGINEILILPIGQYHSYHDCFPIYSGTSMDLGNHVINLKDFLSPENFNKVVKNNNIINKVNFNNIVEINSISEKMLKDLLNNLKPDLKTEFENYKRNKSEIFERKGLFRAFRELYNTPDYKKWDNTDSNLFDENIIKSDVREKRIKEIRELKRETIEFYKFKNFLAEKSLEKAKRELNSKGIKLNGDLLCGYTYDEIWAKPNAFLKDCKFAQWTFPVLDIKSSDAEYILREKVRNYSKWFDGFRVDASWTYITPNIENTKNGTITKLNNGDKFLDIIDDEVKKVKGSNFDLKNIIHEFAADPYKEFNIFSGNNLKQCAKNRVKIYTSDYLSDNWNNADNYIKRGWGDDLFIIGATNHDSPKMTIKEEQVKTLSKILKIPEEKLNNLTEFIKAKFAEPMRAKNNMILFTDALGLDTKLNNNKDYRLNWTAKVPENYEDIYFNNLNNGKGFNPMDALQKQFEAQGLDKTEPKLYKKIIKYRKILESKNNSSPVIKYSVGIFLLGISALGFYKYWLTKKLNVNFGNIDQIMQLNSESH